MAREIRGALASGTGYARIMNKAGLWWNGSTFEAYSASNWSTYAVTMTRQGSSAVIVADFPTGITTGGTYEYFVHKQNGASPAESDTIIVNTGKVDWTGTVSVDDPTGGMTGSDWRDYVLRLGFKRTDKDQELYEATTDAIQEMRRRFMFDEAEADTTTTDTISSLGDFKLSVEDDLGLVLGIVIQDGDVGTPLLPVYKAIFDQLYPSINVESDKGYPRHYSIYAGQIYLGPMPDRTSYTYRINYSRRAGAIVASTASVPFTALYRDVLAHNVNSRLYDMLEEYEKGQYYRQKFEETFLHATRRERINSRAHVWAQRGFHC